MTDFEIIESLNKEIIVVPAEDQYLKDVISFVLQKMGIVEQKFISTISVITEEAYVNVAHYSGSKECAVSLYPDGDEFYMLLEDTGEPFDPLEVNNNPYCQDDVSRRMGGLGILLIKKMSKGVWYRHHDNKNQLLMKITRR